MKRVLVTGATGFIGRHTPALLQDAGYEIHASYIKEPLGGAAGVIWHNANLLEVGSIETLCANIQATHLLHLAWYVNPQDYKTAPENDRWKEASVALVKAFQKNGGERAILAGTCMEYDWTIPQEKLNENTSPMAPATPYGRAKNATRLTVESFSKACELSLAWGRIFNLYGPHEAKSRLIAHIITSLLERKTPNIPAGGLVRDYSYVKDIAGAFVALLESSVAGVVNIASGKPVSLKNIAESVADIMDKRELVEKIPNALSDDEPEKVVADVTRLTGEVGFHARYSLEEGLRETIAWWQAQRSAAVD